MSKLLSLLVAAVFAVSTVSVFAASHMKAAGEKTEEVKKDMTKEEKAAKKEAKKEAKAAKKAAKKEMKKEETK